MEVFLKSIFSIFIACMTVYSMIKALHIAFKRKEISLRKFSGFVTLTVIAGFSVSFVLVVIYEKLFNVLL